MTFIIASLQALLLFVWLLMLWFAAFEVALYLLSAIVEFIDCVREQGWKQIWLNPIHTLRNMHNAGVATLRNSAFRLV